MTVDVHAETRSTRISPKEAGGFALPGWRPLLAGPVVAVVTLAAALIATDDAGIPLRDPDNVTGNRLVMALGFIFSLFVIDVLVRAWSRSDGRLPTRAALVAVRREHWTLQRWLAVVGAIIAFYVTYLAYRNLKSVVPLLRPDQLFDRQLAGFDRSLFFGHDPAALLHEVVGTGFATHAFSGVYMLFFLFIPGTLAAALVFSRRLRGGLFYATALSLNWLLGAISYFLLPSLGPIYVQPADFTGLAGTDAGRLQEVLLEQRTEFLHDPMLGTAQSIGAFASLHVSIFVTAALAAHLLGLRRSVKVVAWILVALTVGATIHLGWHYLADDFGGVAVAALSLALARLLTGVDLGEERRAERAAERRAQRAGEPA